MTSNHTPTGGSASEATKRLVGHGSFLGSGPSSEAYGAFRLYPPRMVDRIFGALFVVEKPGASSIPGALASLFAAPGLFPPRFGGLAAEFATGGLSTGTAGEHGILGPRGIRLPGVGGAAEVALNLVLAGLLVLSLFLLGLSAVPSRLVGRTPLSVAQFREVRPYFVAAALSMLLSVALVYGLGRFDL